MSLVWLGAGLYTTRFLIQILNKDVLDRFNRHTVVMPVCVMFLVMGKVFLFNLLISYIQSIFGLFDLDLEGKKKKLQQIQNYNFLCV